MFATYAVPVLQGSFLTKQECLAHKRFNGDMGKCFKFRFSGLNVHIMWEVMNAFIAYSTVYLYPFVMITQTCSVWILVLITVERYIAICYPFYALRFCNAQRSRNGLLLVVVCAALYNFIRYILKIRVLPLKTSRDKICTNQFLKITIINL